MVDILVQQRHFGMRRRIHHSKGTRHHRKIHSTVRIFVPDPGVGNLNDIAHVESGVELGGLRLVRHPQGHIHRVRSITN